MSFQHFIQYVILQTSCLGTSGTSEHIHSKWNQFRAQFLNNSEINSELSEVYLHYKSQKNLRKYSYLENAESF